MTVCFVLFLQIGASFNQTNVSVWVVDLGVSIQLSGDHLTSPWVSLPCCTNEYNAR